MRHISTLDSAAVAEAAVRAPLSEDMCSLPPRATMTKAGNLSPASMTDDSAGDDEPNSLDLLQNITAHLKADYRLFARLTREQRAAVAVGRPISDAAARKLEKYRSIVTLHLDRLNTFAPDFFDVNDPSNRLCELARLREAVQLPKSDTIDDDDDDDLDTFVADILQRHAQLIQLSEVARDGEQTSRQLLANTAARTDQLMSQVQFLCLERDAATQHVLVLQCEMARLHTHLAKLRIDLANAKAVQSSSGALLLARQSGQLPPMPSPKASI
jgi:hypothetical protein